MVDQPNNSVPFTKNPKVIILAVFSLILVLIIGTYLLVGPTKSSVAEEIEIEITAEGFYPGTIIIDTGDTVRWTNVDTNPHFISSNPHPEESDLPDLTSRGGLGLYGEYNYTFTNPGTYNYHDHLNPTLNGTVIVK